MTRIAEAQKAEGNLLSIYDNAGFSGRYWSTISLLILLQMFEYFDFFVISYVVAVLAPVWHLTYGQSGLILLGAGLGAIFGSLIFGRLADVWGRRPIAILGGLVVAASSAAIVLIPEHSWLLFSVFRIALGVGLGGSMSAQMPYAVEITPTRYRTFITSALVAPVSLGILFASIVSSQLLTIVGWRGLVAIGVLPGLISIALMFIMPESTRWLLSRDRFADARAAAAKQLGVAEQSLPLPTAKPEPKRKAPLRELLAHPRAFWLIVITWLGMSTTTYGYQLWAPTILALVLHIKVAAVATYFIVVGITGFLGRFVFSALPVWVGPRHAGEIMGWGAAILILLARIYHGAFIGPYPAFIVYLSSERFSSTAVLPTCRRLRQSPTR